MDNKDIDAFLSAALQDKGRASNEDGARFAQAFRDERLSRSFAEKRRAPNAVPAFVLAFTLAVAVASGAGIDRGSINMGEKIGREWKREYDSLARDILEAASETARIRLGGELE